MSARLLPVGDFDLRPVRMRCADCNSERRAELPRGFIATAAARATVTMRCAACASTTAHMVVTPAGRS